MDSVPAARIRYWVETIQFPQLGDRPPEFEEERIGTGSNRVNRPCITRALFNLNVEGAFQVVDTVRHSWLVPQPIVSRPSHQLVHVNLYLPLEKYGTVTVEEYRKALIQVTKGLFNAFLGPLHGQPFMLDYAFRRLTKMRDFIACLPLQCFTPSFFESDAPTIDDTNSMETLDFQSSGPQDRFSIQPARLENPPRLQLMVSLPGEPLPWNPTNRPNRFHFIVTIPLQGALTSPTGHAGQGQPVESARREHAFRQVQQTLILLHRNSSL